MLIAALWTSKKSLTRPAVREAPDRHPCGPTRRLGFASSPSGSIIDAIQYVNYEGQTMANLFESRIHPYQGEALGGKMPKWTAEVRLYIGDHVIVVPRHDSDYDMLSAWASTFHDVIEKAAPITIRKQAGHQD